MKPQMREALKWKREREANLWAQIRIERKLLDALVAELAEIRALDGPELLARFGWERPAKDEWKEQVEEVFVRAVAAGRW
jgi:hypothetical protein